MQYEDEGERDGDVEDNSQGVSDSEDDDIIEEGDVSGYDEGQQVSGEEGEMSDGEVVSDDEADEGQNQDDSDIIMIEDDQNSGLDSGTNVYI